MSFASNFLFAFVLLFLAGLILPRLTRFLGFKWDSQPEETRPTSRVSRMLYGACIGLLVLSPVAGLYLALAIGARNLTHTAIAFAGLTAIGLLPLSLAVAKAIGEQAFHDYVRYLEQQGGTTLRRLLVLTATCGAVVLVLSAIAASQA